MEPEEARILSSFFFFYNKKKQNFQEFIQFSSPAAIKTTSLYNLIPKQVVKAHCIDEDMTNN